MILLLFHHSPDKEFSIKRPNFTLLGSLYARFPESWIARKLLSERHWSRPEWNFAHQTVSRLLRATGPWNGTSVSLPMGIAVFAVASFGTQKKSKPSISLCHFGILGSRTLLSPVNLPARVLRTVGAPIGNIRSSAPSWPAPKINP